MALAVDLLLAGVDHDVVTDIEPHTRTLVRFFHGAAAAVLHFVVTTFFM